MQHSFSHLEYAAGKKTTLRNRLFTGVGASAPWPKMIAELEAFYLEVASRQRYRHQTHHQVEMSAIQTAASLLQSVCISHEPLDKRFLTINPMQWRKWQ